MKFSEIPNPKSAAAFIEDFHRQFSSKVCLSPVKDCNGQIISAHTLSVQAMLRPISRKGKVYALKANLFESSENSLFKLVLRGIGETSVFNGFCMKHDKQLFAPIEDKPFTCSHEQIFLFAYRAIAKESYLKPRQATGLTPLEAVKKIHNLPNDVNVEFSPEAMLYQAASARGADEIQRVKSKLDQIYLTKDFSRLCTTVIPFASMPGIACNFVYMPDFDFKGNYLQQFEDFEKDLSQLFVTVF